MEGAQQVNGTRVVTGQVVAADVRGLRQISDDVKNRLGAPSAVVLAAALGWQGRSRRQPAPRGLAEGRGRGDRARGLGRARWRRGWWRDDGPGRRRQPRGHPRRPRKGARDPRPAPRRTRSKSCRHADRGRIAALDLGEVRTGVAVSDPGGVIASPLEVVPSGDLSGLPAPARGRRGTSARSSSGCRRRSAGRSASRPAEFWLH